MGVFGFSLLSLSLVQGEGGALSVLGDPVITTVSIAVLAIVAVLARVFEDRSMRRPPTLIVLLSLFFLWCVLSGVTNVRDTEQWRVFAVYSVIFLLPILYPFTHKSVPLHGLMLGSFVQILAVLVGNERISTISGIGQLSGGVQPNILALQAVSVSLFGAWIAGRSRASAAQVFIGLIASFVGLLAVVGTVSRSGLVALVFAVIIMSMLVVPLRWFILLVLPSLTLILALLGGILPSAWASDWFIRGDATSLSSLTGRTDIWSFSLSMVSAKPFMGWGFGALYAENYSGGFFLKAVEGTNAHNAWLQLAVEVGIVGAVMFLLIFVIVFMCAWRNRRTADGVIVLGMLAALFSNSLASAGFSTLGYAAILFASLISIEAWALKPKRRRRNVHIISHAKLGT
ncbi:O-antigen ligase family protein [Kocuria flava]|uniref:O-antigen ligase family protein n=1 Tax=Kocuria flava TaxID=446860 RepID=UPI00147058EB|nr:O-antigen ligase family protein [Kocuria flava]